MDEQIKGSFNKVKQDIDSLRSELNLTVKILQENRSKISEICDILSSINEHNSLLNEKIKENSQKITSLEQVNSKLFLDNPTDKQTIQQTNRHIIQPNQHIIQTDNPPLEPQKGHFLPFSTGNEGVPTDRQTDRQTDNPTDKQIETPLKIEKKANFNSQEKDQNPFDHAISALDSLDSLKKELRLKFKRLTDQELSVFSLMYQLDEELGYSDYKLLSERLNLTESSIRDYVGRLIRKDIPVDKKKINNKLIQLNISPNLKRIVSLSALLHLRDI